MSDWDIAILFLAVGGAVVAIGVMFWAKARYRLSRQRSQLLRSVFIALGGCMAWVIILLGVGRYHETLVEKRIRQQELADGEADKAARKYAESLTVVDPDTTHYVSALAFPQRPTAQELKNRPLILRSPYPTENELEHFLGKPDLVKNGALVWQTKVLYAHLNRDTGQYSKTKTPDDLIEAQFNSRDGRLEILQIGGSAGYQIVGRTFKSYRESITFVMPR